VDLTVPGGARPQGVLLAQGSALGGFSFHLWEGRPRYLHNLYGKKCYQLLADRPLSAGHHQVVFHFAREGDAGGPARLEVDGETVAETRFPLFTVAAFSATGAGLTCGYEFGPSVGEDYDAPFPCTATIHRATVTLSEDVPINPMVEFERIMAEQ
jgi:arylsulfatase